MNSNEITLKQILSWELTKLRDHMKTERVTYQEIAKMTGFDHTKIWRTITGEGTKIDFSLISKLDEVGLIDIRRSDA